MFSPLEVGKTWFYNELRRIAYVEIYQGTDTYEMRQALGLKKSINKLSNDFNAHCVDSWVLANAIADGHDKPDNIQVLEIVPLRFHRRQLHVFSPGKHGYRRPYGGTRSQGFKRGAIVKNKKYGVCYVGGEDIKKFRISLHDIYTGKRLTQSAKPSETKHLCFNSWRLTAVQTAKLAG